MTCGIRGSCRCRECSSAPTDSRWRFARCRACAPCAGRGGSTSSMRTSATRTATPPMLARALAAACRSRSRCAATRRGTPACLRCVGASPRGCSGPPASLPYRARCASSRCRCPSRPSMLRVVGNGVDIERFAPRDRALSRAPLGIAPDAPVLVSVGGLVERKGFHRVIECLPDLRARHPGLVYLVVGGRESRRRLERAPARAGRFARPSRLRCASWARCRRATSPGRCPLPTCSCSRRPTKAGRTCSSRRWPAGCPS